MTNDFDDSIQGSEEPIESSTETKGLFHSLYETMTDTRKENLRETVKKNMSEMENADLTETELQNMFQQFGTYASLQLVRIVAFKLYGKNANSLMKEIVEGFISQGKQTLMVKHQIDSIEQQGSKLTELLGEDIVQQERDMITKRVDKIYDQFRNEIHDVLLVPDDQLIDDDEDESTEQYPWDANPED